jgi:pimeloyl-ACP methyl ester carboxylesterase
LDERIDDIRAVMDAAGSGRAVLLGISEGGAMTQLFAALRKSASPLEADIAHCEYTP